MKQSVTFTEASIQFNLTGGRPGTGCAVLQRDDRPQLSRPSTPQDTSGFELGHKATLAPGVGFRLFLTQAIHLRAEARGVFWKLNYPPSYTREPRWTPAARATAMP